MFPQSMIPHDPRDPHASVETDSWGLGRLEPTNLVILWPHDLKPEQQEVLDALSKAWGQTVNALGSPAELTDSRYEWLTLAELPKRVNDEVFAPLIIWAEPMRELPSEHLEFLNATHVKWSIVVETLLIPADPLKSFHTLVQLFGKAFPDSPAILDVNKEGWHKRDEIDSEFLVDQEPTEAALFMVHGVCPDNPPTADSPTWLYTYGLARCGLPELEMLEVPQKHARIAISLLTSIGELLMESGMPAPGEPFEIGHDLSITFQPWRDVAAYVGPNSLGGLDRVDHNGDAVEGARAAVCGGQPTGTFKKIWSWPREVVERVAAVGMTVVYKTRRAEQRTVRLSRESWDEFASVFSALPAAFKEDNADRQAVFLVRAGFQPHLDKGAAKSATLDSWDGREHLWFEVKRFKGSRFEGLLVNDPISLSHLRKGDVLWVDRGTISDWQVLTRAGVYGPATVEAMRDGLKSLRDPGSERSPA